MSLWWGEGVLTAPTHFPPPPPSPRPWQRWTHSDLGSDWPCVCLISIHHPACQNHLKHRKESGLGRSSSWAKAPHLGVEQPRVGGPPGQTHTQRQTYRHTDQEGRSSSLSLSGWEQHIPIFKRSSPLFLWGPQELGLLAGYRVGVTGASFRASCLQVGGCSSGSWGLPGDAG